MFILKKGHQPGVYVPLRALFLVLSIFRRIKQYKYILDTIKYIAETALCAARLDFEYDILFFLWVRIPLLPIHFCSSLIYNFVQCFLFFLYVLSFFLFL